MFVIWPKQNYATPITSAATQLSKAQIQAANTDQKNQEVANALKTLKESGSNGNLQALTKLEAMAKQGNTAAQYYVGSIYEHGHYGVNPDAKNARLYFKQCIKTSGQVANASEKYGIAAHNDLACSLARRYDEDYRVAKYSQMAGEQNSLLGKFNWLCTQLFSDDHDLRLSHIISYSPEQVESDTLPTSTYLKLAHLCNDWATALLEKKLVKFDQSYESNFQLLKQCHQITTACLTKLTDASSEVTEIQTKATAIGKRIPMVEKLKIEGKTAQGNSLHDTYLFGVMCMEGDRVKKDASQALALLQSVLDASSQAAASLPNEQLADTYFRVGKLNAYKNIDVMESAYTQAARKGHAQAKQIVDQRSLAIEHFKNAMTLAKAKLGLNDLETIGDFKLAHQYGHPDAAGQLAYWYENHSWNGPSEKDKKEAYEWYGIAAKNGDGRAQKRLEEIDEEQRKNQVEMAKLEKAKLEKTKLSSPVGLAINQGGSGETSESEQN